MTVCRHGEPGFSHPFLGSWCWLDPNFQCSTAPQRHTDLVFFWGFKFKSQPPKPSPKTMKISMKYRAGHNLPTWNQGIKILCPGNCDAFIHQSCFVFLWKSCWCDWALKTMWLVVSFGVRASTFESKETKRNSSNSLIHNHLCSNTIATNWWMKLRGSWTSFEKHQTLTMKVLPIDRGRMSKHYI